jgi:fibro-slime domain-containing protein
MSRIRSLAALSLLSLVHGAGCGAATTQETVPGSNGSGDSGIDAEAPDDDDDDDDSDEDDDSNDDGGNPPDKPPAMVVETLPAGFTEATTSGGYEVVGSLEDFEEPADNTCVNVLRAVIRDFTQAHIDFGEEKPATWTAPGLYTGQVLPALGDDRKPVLNPDRTPKDVIEKLEDWYVTIDGVNEPYVMDLWLEPDPTRKGTFVFDVKDFFPLDDFNSSPSDVQTGGEEDYGPHNFLFTIEIHTSFEYKMGQVFTFRGDDDVFVYVNNQLAVDLGGIHGPVSGSVDLDAEAERLGLKEGEVYSLDLFQAERNPGGSNFRIDTSLDFKECGILPVDVL